MHHSHTFTGTTGNQTLANVVTEVQYKNEKLPTIFQTDLKTATAEYLAENYGVSGQSDLKKKPINTSIATQENTR